MQLTRLLICTEQKSCATNHMMIDELNFKSSVRHIGEMSCTIESYILAPNANWKHLNLVQWIKRKNLSDMLSLNPFKMVHHNQVNKETTALTLQANLLDKDIDCKQSLLCLKVRGEERNTSKQWVGSVQTWYAKQRATRTTRGSQICRSALACHARSHTWFAFFPTDFWAKERLLVVYWGHQDQQWLIALVKSRSL